MGKSDAFEYTYRKKLEALLATQGVVLDYDHDRAAIDTGLHLFVEQEDQTRAASPARVWFQAKGQRSITLPLEKFEAADAIGVRLEVSHLKFWYAFPEPVYVTVYVESADVFLAEDVQAIVDREWPRGTFYSTVHGQQTATIQMPTTATLDVKRHGFDAAPV